VFIQAGADCTCLSQNNKYNMIKKTGCLRGPVFLKTGSGYVGNLSKMRYTDYRTI
jgi:hypothetical protein